MNIRPRLAGIALLVGSTLLLAVACTDDEPSGSQGEAAPDELEGELVWEELYEAEMEAVAQRYEQDTGQPPPEDAEFIRFIDATEYGRVRASCAREYGFEAEETFDGGVAYGQVPEEQRSAFAEAIYRCDVGYPVHPRYLAPPTEEMLRRSYEYHVNEVVPCLIAEGYEVPPVPSWETYRSGRSGDNEAGGWHPYTLVNAPSEEEWQRINETCPQNLPPEELFGTG